MSLDTPAPPNRRRILGSTTLGAAAGLITGLAAGVALALPPKSPPIPPQPGRRRFDGKVVAITGATSGIGRAAALAFAAEGGKVAFCGRRTPLGQQVEREIKAAGGDALYVKADVLVEDEVRALSTPPSAPTAASTSPSTMPASPSRSRCTSTAPRNGTASTTPTCAASSSP
jgi:hypothetical protein